MPFFADKCAICGDKIQKGEPVVGVPGPLHPPGHHLSETLPVQRGEPFHEEVSEAIQAGVRGFEENPGAQRVTAAGDVPAGARVQNRSTGWKPAGLDDPRCAFPNR